jgi:hypothetical protein
MYYRAIRKSHGRFSLTDQSDILTVFAELEPWYL